MRRIVCHSLLCLLALLCCGACDRSSGLGEREPVTGLLSIPALKALARDGTTALRQEVAVQGVVTANDRYGELDRRIVIQDAEGGLFIALEAAELYRRYPIGRRLTLYCNGLTLRDYGGRIEVIADPDAPYGAVGLRPAAFDRHLHAADPATDTPRPALRRIDELASVAADTYVRLEEVRFVETGVWCRRDPQTGRPLATRRTVVDRAGNRLPVYVPATVRYADEPLPAGEGALCGIVERFGGDCSLRVVDRGLFFDAPRAATAPSRR